MPNLSKTEEKLLKHLGASLTAESAVAALIAAFFALWVYVSYKDGKLAGGALIAGLLYVRLTFAIGNNEPNSRNRVWALAALPVITTPAGIIVCIATLLLVNRLRKMPLKANSVAVPVGERKEGISLPEGANAVSWWEKVQLHKTALISAAVVVGLVILAFVFRYEEGGVGGAVFRYDRFTKVVYIQDSYTSGGWAKTDFVNLQHAIDTMKLRGGRRY